MTSIRRRPTHGVWRWFGVLLVSAAIATLLAPVGAAAAPLRAELSLSTLAPVSVQPGDTLRAQGAFTVNRTLDDVVVRLEVSTTAFATRGAVTDAAANPPFTVPVTGAEDDLGKVRRGASETFNVRVPADDLPFFSSGVYGMRVVAVDASTGAELASVSTFLPWAPDGVGVLPSRLLLFWPLMGLPVRDSVGALTDDDLGESLTGDGRLSVLLQEGARAPSTWVVDPALLDDVAAVDSPGAEQWLQTMRDAARTREVVALPYGDPDVAAVASAGRPGVLLDGQLKADRVYERVTGTPARSDLAWPADGAADEQVLSVAGRAGDTLSLLSAESAPLVTELPYTPSGRLTLAEPEMEVLLADPAVSALAAAPAVTPEGVLLARQRFLAETLLHSLELPQDPRLLVVAPPRRWDPSAAWAEELVTAVRKAPWLNPVSIDEAIRPAAPTAERIAPSISEDSTARQLPDTMVDDAADGLVDNRRLAAILTRPRQLSGPIEDALFTSLSTAWRADVPAAELSQTATLDRLAAHRGRVRIVTKGGTLSDDRGTFPVTLRNQLDQPVVVRLRVSSTDSLRLRVEAPDDRIRIAAQRSELVAVQLDAVTTGRLTFEAQLLTPRGAAYDDPVTVPVDVRGFGQITLVVFGVAVGLLLIAAAIRVARRIRAARRRTAS
jgi:hypothetical protein